jgi:transposase
MDVIVDRVAGVDVHKDQVTVCVRVPDGEGGRCQQVRQFRTFTAHLRGLRDWLGGLGVSTVVMESTGVYWRPVWSVLEDDFECLLVNARHAHNVPGRKTDVADAAWLAQLGECGLLRGSFVPDRALKQLRDLTRYRRRLIETCTRESQRLTKCLEDAGIKLDSVASKVTTLSAQDMVRALCAGQRDPVVLADLARGRMRVKIPELRYALEGRFDEHHALLCRLHLTRMDDLRVAVAQLDADIARRMEPFATQRDRLCTIPGVATRTAEVIIAEIGTDMSRFPTAGHLASWAGMCPGNHQSATTRGSGRTRPGDHWLRTALCEAAWAAARTKPGTTYLGSQFWRLARRRGKNKAAVAVGHSILVAAYHMLRDNVDYTDLGGDWFSRRHDTDQRRAWLIRQLEALGATVTVN